MTRYEVKFSAVGEAFIEVEADNEDDAILKASKEAVGIIIEGGEASWEVESVQEILT